ncbi:MAG: alpha/beta hydrolase [Sphingobacteriales bacterium]
MLTALISVGQEKKLYRDMIYPSANIQTGLNYAADTVNSNRKSDYEFDLYSPQGGAQKDRPLIIWLHGGGFVFGSEKDGNIRLWCETFARRGYVCAAINYRLGKKTSLLNLGKLAGNAYPAVLDARQAVHYFRAHAKTYGIDPRRIILAGNSAGAMIALQATFSYNRELADSLRISNPAPYGNINGGPEQILTVINFWGGIYNINWLANAPAAVVSVYGSRDRIVRPGFHNGTYGGSAITTKMAALHRLAESKVFEGYGHELYKHFNPLPLHPGKAGIRKRWLEAGQFAASFLAERVFH